MPKHAKEALIHRMERLGTLDQLSADARILFRKRLRFNCEEAEPVSAKQVSAPLQVGAIMIGFLTMPASVKPERNTAYQHWLEMACMVLAKELSAPHPHHASALPVRVTHAVRLIKDHYTEALTLGEVASQVGVSRERLSRLFHDTLGITFSAYLSEVRLAEARNQLSGSSSRITEIAFSCGFQSLSQFNRCFRNIEGITPTEYRKRNAMQKEPYVPSRSVNKE